MKNVILSVIIPVYNTEKYLAKLFQSIPFVEDIAIEWIFVDDGSEDGSVSIVENFQKEHENVFLEKQAHRGAPMARNCGLYQSKGKYIYFFDSDDYFEDGIFTKIIEILQSEQPDILIGNGYIVDEKYNKTGEKFKGLQDKMSDSPKELFFIDSNPGNKIFRRDIIMDNWIIFDDVAIHQDLNFYLKYIPFCSKIRYISDFMYDYLVRGDSIAHSVSGKIVDVIKSMDGVLQYYGKRNLLHQYEKELEYNYVKHLCFQIEKLPYMDSVKEEIMVAQEFIKVLKKLNYESNEYINKERTDIIDNLLKKENIYLTGNYDAIFLEKKKRYDLQERRLDLYNWVLMKWLSHKIQKKENCSYLFKQGISKVAIYGMGSLGGLLYEDLKQSQIKIAYIVDQRAEEVFFGSEDIKVIKSEEIKNQEKVDAIIITAVHAYEDICRNLKNTGVDIRVISLEDLLND